MKFVQLSILSSLALAITACEGDIVVSKGTNAAPNVLISSHAEGESFASGETVLFRAVATDDDNEAADKPDVCSVTKPSMATSSGRPSACTMGEGGRPFNASPDIRKPGGAGAECLHESPAT